MEIDTLSTVIRLKRVSKYSHSYIRARESSWTSTTGMTRVSWSRPPQPVGAIRIIRAITPQISLPLTLTCMGSRRQFQETWLLFPCPAISRDPERKVSSILLSSGCGLTHYRQTLREKLVRELIFTLTMLFLGVPLTAHPSGDRQHGLPYNSLWAELPSVARSRKNVLLPTWVNTSLQT